MTLVKKREIKPLRLTQPLNGENVYLCTLRQGKLKTMKRIFIKWFVVPLFLWMSVGCKYYQYRPDMGLERWEYQTFDDEEWKRVDERYYLVLHYGTDTLELYDVEYSNYEFKGYVRPFNGLPLEYYKHAVPYPGENIRRPFFGESGPATNQIHFFLDRCTKLDSSQVKFGLYQDVKNVESVKQSPKNYIGGTAFALGIGASVYIGIFIFILVKGNDK